jgi:superfamily II DNA/RNA helicase
MFATQPSTGPDLTDPSTATAETADIAPHDTIPDGGAIPAPAVPTDVPLLEAAVLEAAVPEAAVPAEAAPEPAVPEPAVPEPAEPEPVVAVEAPEEPAPAAVEAAEAEEPSDEARTEQEEADSWGVEDPEPEEPARPVFADLGLSQEVLRAVGDMGYLHPTPIQEQAIPYVLMGRDVMGTAQTGTGKTAGFTLPMLDILSGSRARARMPRSLILEPTRELAMQVAENFAMYGKYLKLTHALIIGGESMSDQKEILNKGVDVLIATPGRLIDMFDRGLMLLTDAKLLVIDEADRMLDMGFIPDVERIVSMLPPGRQTLFFSATMGPEIRRLADAFLNNPKEIAVSRAASVAPTITEGLALVAEHDKREALRRLIRTENVQNALIFCNRKVDVDILYKSLTKHKFSAGALHGDLSQTVRFATLEKFKAGDLHLLVCSDVAARGIDIGGLSHVFNFDVPHHAEDYVHRIGRTGRAGLEGRAFTIAAPTDRFAVEAIEKLTGHAIPPVTVQGLDPVDWEEGDGRKRRGRGGPKKGAAAPRKSATREKPPAAPREEKPMREARPPRERTPRAPREVVAPVEEIRAEPVVAERPRWERDRERDRPRGGDFRRERGRRDDDLGAGVMGFGDDVPAFMLLRTRGAQPLQETESEA